MDMLLLCFRRRQLHIPTAVDPPPYINRQDTHPLNIFYGIRWSEASENPLSHIHGKKGEKFVLIEPIGQHGTGTM
jgi:hypothetical protein